MIATVMTTGEMVAVGLWTAGLLLLFTGFIWVGDRLLDRKAAAPPRTDQRMSAADRAISIWDADDYFHGTGALRLRLHEYRRQLAAEQKETAATYDRPAV